MKNIRLGIIGIGNMGANHAKYIQKGNCPDFTVTAVADTNPNRLDWAKKQKFGENIGFFDDGIALLDSGLVDACIIATPHYFHPIFAMECLKRNIHVMVEKPAGVYTKNVREMNKLAAQHPDVVFGMMFNQRTNCVYRKLRELVQSGKYGEIRRTNWLITNWYRSQGYYNSGNWRATWSGEGGGVLLNQAPHNLDLWQWICGMPVKVLTKMHFGKWHDIEVEDDVTTYVEYANGATGVFITTTGDTHGTNRLEIQMDKAKFVVENDKLYMDEYEMTEQEYSKRSVESNESFGKMQSVYCGEVETDGQCSAHVGVLNAFGDAILFGGELVARGEEGINGLTLSNAMHLSAFLGKEITIPFDEDLYYEELMKRVASSKEKTSTKTIFADISDTFSGA